MYRAILVDDEDIDLAALTELVPWTDFGIDLLGSFHSSSAAFRFLSEREIDILVTDIQMPLMSGLELAEKAKLTNPGLKVLFISGYEEFHYARTAVTLQASGYIVKPVHYEELFDRLRGIAGEIGRTRMLHEAQSRLDTALPLARSEYIVRLLEGRDLPGEYDDVWLEQLDLQDAACMRTAVFEIDDAAWKLNHYLPDERSRLLADMMETLLAELQRHKLGAAARLAELRAALLIRGGGRDELGLELRLQQIIDAVTERFPLTVTAALGGMSRSVYDIPASYAQAKELLACKMFAGKGGVIVSRSVGSDTGRNAADMEERLHRLFASVIQYRLTDICDNLDELFEWLQTIGSRVSVYHTALHLFARLDAYLRGMNEQLTDLPEMDHRQLDLLLHFETADDVHSWLRKALFAISERLHDKKQGGKRLALAEAMERYVDSRGEAPVKLRDVGDYFAFTPGYLSELYKEARGEPFTEYLIRRRLELACGLLRQPELKIYEVADRLGYRSLTYFNRLFKERLGVSPGEYRSIALGAGR